MAHLSIEKLRSPRSPRRSSGSFFYPESGNNSGSSTPFMSAPSSPRCYYYFSAPPSPPRGREMDTAAAVPFSWEEKPGTPKKSDSATAGDANFGKEGNGAMKNSVDHLTAMGFHFSAPVSPQRDFNFMDGYLQQPMNSGKPLDEFEFSSARMSDVESVASSTMLHADELFFQGQILPLKLPPRLQQHKSNLSLSLQLQDFSPRAQDSISFSPRSAAGSSFVHQLHSPRSPKSPQPPSLFSPKSPTGYRNPKSPRAKSPSRLPKVGSSDENKHPSRMQAQPRPPSSISSVRRSLRELLHLNNSTSSSGSIMKKDGSVKSSGTDSSKSSRSSSSSSQRYSSSRSSSVSSNKSSNSARNSFSSSRQVNPLPREFLQNYGKNYKNNAEALRRRTFLPYKQGLLGCLSCISADSFREIQDLRETRN